LNFYVDYSSSEPESDCDSELSDISKSSEVVYVVSQKRKEKTSQAQAQAPNALAQAQAPLFG
jgi:hypothetical protein